MPTISSSILVPGIRSRYFHIEVCRTFYHNHVVPSEDKMIGPKVIAPGIRVRVTTK